MFYAHPQKMEPYIQGDQKIEYDGRGIVLHLADQMAFSGIPRFTLGGKGDPVMVGGGIGVQPMKREPIRMVDPCVIVFKESISMPLPDGFRAFIMADTRAAMFGVILAQMLTPIGYYGPLQTTLFPARRLEIATGYPIARLYFVDDSTLDEDESEK